MDYRDSPTASASRQEIFETVIRVAEGGIELQAELTLYIS